MNNQQPRLDADSARALARVVVQIRPDWTTTGIANTLWQLRDRPASLVAIAAVLAAADPSIDTPAGIAWTDRPHWRQATAATAVSDAGPDLDADTLRHRRLAEQRAAELARRASPEVRARIRRRLEDAGVFTPRAPKGPTK